MIMNKRFFRKENKKPYKKNFHKGITCYNCNIEGHYAADCRKPKKNTNKKANLSVKDNNQEVDKDTDANFLFQTYNTISNRNTWFLDFRATNHACCTKKIFYDNDAIQFKY